MASGRVRVTEHDWGLLVELCAPEVRNALDSEAVGALLDALRRPGTTPVVLTGVGPVFCAGGDLGALSSAASSGGLPALLAAAGARFAELIEAIVASPRPVIAAVRGAAVGGGMSLALACDVRIAGPSTRLIPGWGRWGLPPDGGASALLAALVGPGVAADLLMRDAPLAAESAGPVFAEVVADEQVVAAGIAAAQALPPGAVAAKAVTRGLVLPVLRGQLTAELAALRAAADDPAVVARLTVLATGGL